MFAVSVWADTGENQKPDYVTDYFMIVECAEGGIDIYPEADVESGKLNSALIPNGTALRIEGEKTGEDKKEWGYTQYHGMYGYVPMDTKTSSRLSTISFPLRNFTTMSLP